MRKPRSEMIAETRAKLLAAGREAFGNVGYAEASMDDFTAAAGLTRGALYHHFGDKKDCCRPLSTKSMPKWQEGFAAFRLKRHRAGKASWTRTSAMWRWHWSQRSSVSCFATGRRCWATPLDGQARTAVSPPLPKVFAAFARKEPSSILIRKPELASSMRQAAAPRSGSPIRIIRKLPRNGQSQLSALFSRDC